MRQVDRLLSTAGPGVRRGRDRGRRLQLQRDSIRRFDRGEKEDGQDQVKKRHQVPVPVAQRLSPQRLTLFIELLHRALNAVVI